MIGYGLWFMLPLCRCTDITNRNRCTFTVPPCQFRDTLCMKSDWVQLKGGLDEFTVHGLIDPAAPFSYLVVTPPCLY